MLTLNDACVRRCEQGFPTVKDVTPFQNNPHGPGSPHVRVYWFTVNTFGENVDEVQYFGTTADQGQTLGGSFTLTYKGSTSQDIPHVAHPTKARALLSCLCLSQATSGASAMVLLVCLQVKEAIEEALPLAGLVDVSRSARDDQVPPCTLDAHVDTCEASAFVCCDCCGGWYSAGRLLMERDVQDCGW